MSEDDRNNWYFPRNSGLKAYHFKEDPKWDHVSVIVNIACWSLIILCLIVMLVIA